MFVQEKKELPKEKEKETKAKKNKRSSAVASSLIHGVPFRGDHASLMDHDHGSWWLVIKGHNFIKRYHARFSSPAVAAALLLSATILAKVRTTSLGIWSQSSDRV